MYYPLRQNIGREQSPNNIIESQKQEADRRKSLEVARRNATDNQMPDSRKVLDNQREAYKTLPMPKESSISDETAQTHETVGALSEIPQNNKDAIKKPGTFKETAKKLKEVRDSARNLRSIGGATKEMRKKVKKTLALISSVDPFLDCFFAIAFLVALFKDIADFTGVGSLPFIGTVCTILASSVIFCCLIITGSLSKKAAAKKIAKKITQILTRYSALAGGTLIEFLLGPNIFPIETLTVILIYYLTLKERAENREAEKEQQAQEIAVQQQEFA